MVAPEGCGPGAAGAARRSSYGDVEGDETNVRRRAQKGRAARASMLGE